jgi:predicted DNA-binding protein
MSRTNVFMTREMQEGIKEQAERRSVQQADIIREALEWYLALTQYSKDAMAELQAIHPEKTPQEIINWVIFKFIEDRKGRKSNGGPDIHQEIKEIKHALGRLLSAFTTQPEGPASQGGGIMLTAGGPTEDVPDRTQASSPLQDRIRD